MSSVVSSMGWVSLFLEPGRRHKKTAVALAVSEILI
jgi:hypothetical protein